MSTKERLAAVLREHKHTEMASKALAGYYDDFESELAFPIAQLVRDLQKRGDFELAERVKNGEFDATDKEADEWYRTVFLKDAALNG